jgi:hypothetical protein
MCGKVDSSAAVSGLAAKERRWNRLFVCLSLVAPGGCDDGASQRLQQAEARGAQQEALMRCRMTTDWRPGDPVLDKIVQTCAEGLAPDIYQREMAGDRARLAATAARD